MVLVVVGLIVGGMLVVSNGGRDNHAEAATSRLRLEDIPFDGRRAYDYLKQICAIGPRPSGSTGMARQQQLLTDHFQKLGAEVELQKFSAPDPRDGQLVPMANLIVRWRPEKKERILLCAHYDTLPFPMLDRRNPRGRFIGANDGGSGVALLMELGNEMPKLDLKYGVDFVFFDAEEYIFSHRDRFFLGSEFFARDYRENPPKFRYRWGVLLDMIGDRDLQILQERNSLWWRDTRPLVADIWATAARLGVREFIPRPGVEIRDDHLPLHNIGGIPTCVVIDFIYPDAKNSYWHTTQDTVDKCSPLSLAKVGWVIREWLKTVR
ncbi:MAG: M28 family peptidase [Pirellulales bacterium]|nr:M28 family peptidase [Pirellulales bacterium]